MAFAKRSGEYVRKNGIYGSVYSKGIADFLSGGHLLPTDTARE